MSVARLSLGTAQFGLPYGIANRTGQLEASAIEAILREAEVAGVQHLDCAASYGDAESRLGQHFAQRGGPCPFAIGTKLPSLPAGLSASEVNAQVESSVTGSLRRLRVEVIDDYSIHEAANWTAYGTPLLEALQDQRERGRIRRLGISLYDPEELEALDDRGLLALAQLPLSLLDQRLLRGGRIDEAHGRGFELHGRSVFLQGLLSLNPLHLEPPMHHARATLMELRLLLAKWGLTPMEAALPFAMGTGLDRVLIGVDSLAQLEANLESAQESLPEELMVALRAGFAQVGLDLIDPRRW